MKKNTTNFWIDILIFIDFVAVVFTGVLLREFPSELSGGTTKDFPSRKDLKAAYLKASSFEVDKKRRY